MAPASSPTRDCACAPASSATYASARRRDHRRAAAGSRDLCHAGTDRGRSSRAGVFDERATAMCLPPGVHADRDRRLGSRSRAGLGARRPKAARSAFVGPDDVTVNARGRGTYAREVHDLFVRDPYAKRLMVGETFNPPGHWSSFPPHKHDGRNGEPCLEEVYHFRVSPAHGFGHQMLYTEDGEVGHAPGARRRRGAAAVRLSPGLGAARLLALLPVGDGRRPAAARALRRSRRIAGFTTTTGPRAARARWPRVSSVADLRVPTCD